MRMHGAMVPRSGTEGFGTVGGKCTVDHSYLGPRWWQLKDLLCSLRNLGKISNSTNIFSDGLKPQSSYYCLLLLIKFCCFFLAGCFFLQRFRFSFPHSCQKIPTSWKAPEEVQSLCLQLAQLAITGLKWEKKTYQK